MTNFRTKVFQQAWQIAKSTGKSFAVALSKSWQLYKLRKKMAEKTVKFAFEKVDGSLRVAYGTLQDVNVKGKRRENNKTFAYFDVEKEAFRCFRVENLIKIYNN